MTRPSSPYPFPIPKDTTPATSGQYPGVQQEQHTLSPSRPPSSSTKLPDEVANPFVIRNIPPATRMTRAILIPEVVPPTVKMDRPVFLEAPMASSSSVPPLSIAPLASTRFAGTMAHPLMIPSFTGTTAMESMRYEKHILVRIWQSFLHNNAFLMAGGVAYNMLLSIIPLFALIFVVLSQFFEKDILLSTMTNHLQHLIPGKPQLIQMQLSYFLENRQLFGGITLFLLLFFSTLAFKSLENAMSVIFAYDKTRAQRRFWVSATIPYLYILCIFAGILLLTGLVSAFENAASGRVSLLGFTWSVAAVNSVVLYLLNFLGLGLMLSSLYMVMPKCPISFRRALAGGLVAAALWEITRYVLMWYFTKVSMVNAIYGPIGTVIIVLLSFEIAAIILLLGAQVIAELQRAEIYRQMISVAHVSKGTSIR